MRVQNMRDDEFFMKKSKDVLFTKLSNIHSPMLRSPGHGDTSLLAAWTLSGLSFGSF